MSAPKDSKPIGDSGNTPKDAAIAKAAGALIATGIAWSLYKALTPAPPKDQQQLVQEPYDSVPADESPTDALSSTLKELESDAKEKTEEFSAAVEARVKEAKRKGEELSSEVADAARVAYREGKKKENKAIRTFKSGLSYEINKGDTLYGISRKYGISVDALKAANALSGDLIYAGDKLVIPK